MGPAFADRALLSVARRIQASGALPAGALGTPLQLGDVPAVSDPQMIDVLVCGAHLDGLPLNWQLRERGAVLKQSTQTAPVYRMYALAGGPPARPGLPKTVFRSVFLSVLSL